MQFVYVYMCVCERERKGGYHVCHIYTESAHLDLCHAPPLKWMEERHEWLVIVWGNTGSGLCVVMAEQNGAVVGVPSGPSHADSG